MHLEVQVHPTTLNMITTKTNYTLHHQEEKRNQMLDPNMFKVINLKRINNKFMTDSFPLSPTHLL